MCDVDNDTFVSGPGDISPALVDVVSKKASEICVFFVRRSSKETEEEVTGQLYYGQVGLLPGHHLQRILAPMTTEDCHPMLLSITKTALKQPQ